MGAGVDDILSSLRESGGRVTSTRRAMVEALVGNGGHLSAEDLTVRLHSRHPELALSTAYRILADLEERGLVHHIHLGHGPALWHLPDRPHYHLVCTECGSITEVPARVLDQLIADLQDEHGFHLDAAHFELQGRCRDCAAPPLASTDANPTQPEFDPT